MNKLTGVEAARGMAALLVVLVHASSMFGAAKYFGELPLGGLFTFGHAGVDFFFVLSGFIIYFIHANELGQARYLASYWLKRFIRLMPVYWVVLAGYAALLIVSPTPDRYEQSLSAVLTSIFLIPQNHTPILGVSWSLSHEILFYSLFSLFFISKPIGRVFFFLWGGAIVFNVLTHYFQDWFWGGFVFRIFNAEFFFGLLVAHALRSKMIRFPMTALVLGASLFFAAGLHESWGNINLPEWPPRHLAYATGAALALYGLVGLEVQNRLRLPDIACVLGEASYSIYLTHVITLLLLQQGYLVLKRFVEPPSLAVFLAAVVLAVVVGIQFSRHIEQPLLKYCRRRLLRKVTS